MDLCISNWRTLPLLIMASCAVGKKTSFQAAASQGGSIQESEVLTRLLEYILLYARDFGVAFARLSWTFSAPLGLCRSTPSPRVIMSVFREPHHIQNASLKLFGLPQDTRDRLPHYTVRRRPTKDWKK
jgi:hypothetical protein